MPKKTNPSIVPRLTGAVGRANLLAAICAQQSVSGDADLARRLISAGKLQEYRPGRTIVKQGDADNDMYMIISGSVAVIINKREIAVRSNGNHVGEMALLDPTARRSATLVAREPTVVLKLSEGAITRVASSFPAFWRRVAVAISTRLRERTKFIHAPNLSPIVFIGSSSEALSDATCISRSLSRRNLTCKLWTQGVFQLSQTTIEDLIRASHEVDFAVIFLTADDMTSSKGRRRASPRDNIIFEIGLFMGAIGRDRTFLAVPRGIDLKLPTDLLGITHAPYARGGRSPRGKRLLPVSQLMWRRINQLGPR
jgi:predicted nucleotide-binding protein